ncbi:unnamed protein product [Adineta ricciae]|uniref:Uncharacterized protein n=2 Tax=Adineta ricciae TaxID=249248 RepID=A0A815IP18_ADIRI|nr:unnamed protein product [Adineta ricciae]
MSRYHYSRHAPSSARSESLGPRQSSNGHLSKSVNSIATTSNNHMHSPPMTPKSSYIPLVRNSRSTTTDKRDFVQIPVKREDGTTITHNGIRSIPINFINETTPLPSHTINSINSNNHIRDTDSPPRYASLLRPSSKYFQHHLNNNNTATAKDESEEPNSQQIPITINDNLPRLQPTSRRLSLTVPVMTPTAPTSPPDDDQSKQNSVNSPVRSIPIRLSQPLNVASIPTNSARISSAILRSSPPTNPLVNHLQRQKTDLVNSTISSDFTSMPVNTSPIRRAELMAREAIQGITRFQQQQQQAPLPTPPQPLLQQRKHSISDGASDTSIRSPLLSRRVIVNLKNNQSVSLDSRISSATSLPTKPSSMAATSRSNQRNNLYHIPVLHEIQIPPQPATVATESLLNFPRSSASNHRNPNNYKNEFRMEIPVTVVANNDQENFTQNTITSTDGILDYDLPIPTVPVLRIPSASSNQALKSILKRSASRETVLRKNVSFMNA